MTQINNGGPAFPVTDFVVDSKAGMTLRDWFAGRALQALLSECGHKCDPSLWAEFAATAYQIADAMIAARGAKA